MTPRTTGKRKRDPFDEVSFYLGRAYYDHIKLLERLLEEQGLSEYLRPGMGQILFSLFEKDDRIIKDLSSQLRLSPSHLTATLGRMTEAGVISCRGDTKDRRAVRVRLTRFGRSLKPKCRKVLKDLNAILCGGIPAGDRTKIKRNLGQMVENAKEYVKGGSL